MSAVENGRLNPSQAASFPPFTSSQSFDAHSRGFQTPFGLTPSHTASTSHHLSNRIPRSARPHLQSFPDHHLSSNAFGWSEAHVTAIDPSLFSNHQSPNESPLTYPPHDTDSSRSISSDALVQSSYPRSIPVSSSTLSLLSIGPLNVSLPAPFSQFGPHPDLHKNAEEERERQQGL
jgi:hypothetical protein